MRLSHSTEAQWTTSHCRLPSPTRGWRFTDAQYGLLWLAASYIKATRPVMEIFKIAGCFPDSPLTSLQTLNIFNFLYFCIHPCFILLWAGIAKSILRLATGWTVRGSNPSGGEDFRTRPDLPWAHPASYTIGTGSFPVVKRPGRGFNHPPHLAPRLKEK